MNSQKKIAFVFGLICFVILFVWFMDYSSGTIGESKKGYSSSNWKRKYKLDDKDPYGLYLFNTLLKSHVDKKQHVKTINDWVQYDTVVKDKINASYLFVGDQFELLNSEIEYLLNNVSEGSDLVMSFNHLSRNIYDKIFLYVDYSFDYSDSITVFTGQNKYVFYNQHQTDTLATEWYGFNTISPIDTNYTVLSSFMETSNFIKIKHGKGTIFLHTNPQFFFNYQLLRKNGFEQSVYFMNQIQKNKNIYWLEIGRKQEAGSKKQSGNGGKQDDSYFKLLFKHPSLLFALLLVILGFILFLLFRAKRMRPVVPYRPIKKNMTLVFADTITSIYFAKQSPKGLLQVQKKNFYSTVLKHFFVDLSRRDGDKEIMTLSEKSNVSFDELKEFIELLENRKVKDVDGKYIANVSKWQREFYKNTGVISQFIQQRINNHEKRYNRTIWQAALFIMTGVFGIILGFYCLILSLGFGVIFWPFGMLLVSLGIIRLRKPLFTTTRESITVYPLIGKPNTYPTNELLNIHTTSSIIHFYFTENRKIKIKSWEMSKFDKKQFERYISNLHTSEL